MTDMESAVVGGVAGIVLVGAGGESENVVLLECVCHVDLRRMAESHVLCPRVALFELKSFGSLLQGHQGLTQRGQLTVRKEVGQCPSGQKVPTGVDSVVR